MTLPIHSGMINSPSWYLSSILDTFEWNHEEKSGIFFYGSRNLIYFLKLHELPNQCGQYLDEKFPKSSYETTIQYYMKAHHEHIIGVCTIPNSPPMAFQSTKLVPKLASVGKDRLVRIWSYDTVAGCACLSQLNLSSISRIANSNPSCISISHDNVIFLGFESGHLLSWDFLASPGTASSSSASQQTSHLSSVTKVFPTMTEHILSISWRANQFAVAYKTGFVTVFTYHSFDSIAKVTQLCAHSAGMCSLAWNPSTHSHDSWGDLATAGKDRKVKLWKIDKNLCLRTLTLPTRKSAASNNADPPPTDSGPPSSSSWAALCWPPSTGSLTVATGTGNIGIWQSPSSSELKYFSIDSGAKPHSKSIFSITEFRNHGQPALLLSHSLDRLINVTRLTMTDKSVGQLVHSIPGLGGSVLALATVAHSNQIAIGCADNQIRLWRAETRVDSGTIDSVSIWNGVRGKVLAVRWHPTKEGVLAFGTDGGEAAIASTAREKKTATVSRLQHAGKVFVVAWAVDIRLGMSSGSSSTKLASEPRENRDALVVYTVGAYALLLHDFRRDSCEDVTAMVANVGMRVADFAAHDGLHYFAVGFANGLVRVFAVRSVLQLVCELRTHSKGVNCMRWLPGSVEFRLAVGSNERFATVTDLGKVIGDFESTDRPQHWEVVEFNETLAMLKGHGDRITAVDWCPLDSDKLVTASYDHTAFVWTVKGSCALASFVCHQGKLLCCQWSQRDADLVYTGAEDGNLFAWRPSEHAVIKGGFNKRRNFVPSLPGICDKGGDLATDNGDVADSGTLRETEERQLSVTSAMGDLTEAIGTGTTKTPSEIDCKEMTANRLLKSSAKGKDGRTASTNSADPKDKPTYTKKRSSLFPTTIFSLHHALPAYQTAVLNFIEGGKDYLPFLALLDSRAVIVQQIERELEHHKAERNYDNYFLLLLWLGKVSRVASECVSMKFSADWLMTLISWHLAREVPMELVSMVAGNAISGKKDPVLAATYWLACGQPRAAIELLIKNECLREALILAKLRLPPNDSIIEGLLPVLKEQFYRNGSFELATVCSVLIKQFKDAIESMSRRNSKLASWVTIKILIYHHQDELLHPYLFNFINGILLEVLEERESETSTNQQWIDKIRSTNEISIYGVLMDLHRYLWLDRISLKDIWMVLKDRCDGSKLSAMRSQIHSKLVTKQINQSENQISVYLTYEMMLLIINYCDRKEDDFEDDSVIFVQWNDLISQYNSANCMGQQFVNRLIGTEQEEQEDIIKLMTKNLVNLKLQEDPIELKL